MKRLFKDRRAPRLRSRRTKSARVGVWSLACASLFALAACGTSFAAGGSHANVKSLSGKTVYLINCPDATPWCGAYHHMIQSQLAKVGVKLVALTDDFSAGQEIQHLQEAIAARPAAIIINAGDSTAVVPSIKRAKAAGIPVVNGDAPLAGNPVSSLAFQVIANHFVVGVYAAEGLVKGFKEEGLKKANILIAAGALAQYAAQQRLAGFKSYIKKFPQYKIVSVQDTSWDQGKAAQDAQQVFAQYSGRGGIQGTYGMNDLLALGVVKAAQQAGLKVGVKDHGLVVAGGNCLAPGIPALESGEMISSATQTPGPEGAAVVQNLVKYLRGGHVPKTITLAEYMITKSNVSKFKAQCTF